MVARAPLLLAGLLLACASSGDPMRYRLGSTGTHWADTGDRTVVAELRERYPEFFEVVLDPARTGDPDLRPIRDDLERAPVDRRNYDALNALAIAYFELNYRAESDRGGSSYLGNSFRTAHLLAVPWRAYGEIDAPELRNAILDFYEDAGSGEKLGTAATAPRLARIVADLERKEDDPGRRARIGSLVASLHQRSSPASTSPF
jgi:hypothetical protein